MIACMTVMNLRTKEIKKYLNYENQNEFTRKIFKKTSGGDVPFVRIGIRFGTAFNAILDGLKNEYRTST